MGHSHKHHHHSQNTGELNGRRLSIAILINVLLTIVQVLGGLASGSLSLVADGLHNFSDAGSLVVAYFARRIAGLPSTKTMTYGYGRAEILGALINSVSLVLMALYLLYEAYGRYQDLTPINGWTLIIIAGVALVVDLATAWLTYKGSKDSINMRAAFIHNMTDALASVGVIISGTLILFYQIYWIDLVLTVLIAAYIIYHSWELISSCIKTLMQAVPDELAIDDICKRLCAMDDVEDVHHMHVWQIHERFRSLEAHVVIKACDVLTSEQIKNRIKECLKTEFHIQHSTLEFEYDEVSCKH